MICWKCQAEFEDFEGRVPFRSSCESCASWLHVCVNCKHYKIGLPNDCAIPDTVRVNDREKYNFCEDFSLKAPSPKEESDISKVAKQLFGNDGEEENKKNSGKDGFNSLFAD
jgi:hypothetical protein